MKLYLFFVLGFFLISCGATVNYDYDREVDFSKYKSYNYFPSLSSGMSELDDKRIMRATDSLLQERGFIKSKTPDVFINFYSKEYTSNSRNTIGFGLGSGGRNTSVGVSGGIPIGGKVVNQQLTIDFIDAEEDALFWQAVAENEYKENASPQEKENHFYTTLQKIFNKYPPKK